MDTGSNYLRLLLLKSETSNLKCLKNNTSNLKEKQFLVPLDKTVIRNDIIPLINSEIHGNKEERLKGLIILRKILPQFPPDIFADYALSWMLQCCKWDSETVNEELKVLRILLSYSCTSPDVKKQVISSLLVRFSERLLSHRRDKCEKVVKLKLKCLRSITDSYSSSCGPYRNDFHKYVMYCLKQFPERKKIVREAALCFVSLCQCSSKGQQGVNHKEMWSSQLKALLDTCHKLCDSIYKCVDYTGLRSDVSSENAISALLDICENGSKDPLVRFHNWKITFTVLGELLQAMFLHKYPVCKSFKPHDVFALICRFLAVNGNTMKNCTQSNDVLCLNAILPDIHSITLDILRSFILFATRNLIPYGTLICKLGLQSLKWTQSSDWKYGTSKPYESLRCKVYSVLSSWVSMSSSASSIELFADEIIPIIVSDVELLKPEIQLTTVTKQTKGNKRKGDRNVANSNQQFQSLVVTDSTVNNKICIVAHRLLQTMIRNSHCLIKWEHHKTLQYTIIPLLSEIIRANSPSDYPLPYSDAKCRLELFKTLYTLTIWPHSKWKTPLPLAARIFDSGRNDDVLEVSAFCILAANELEAIIHPRGPSLSVWTSDIEENSALKMANSQASKAFCPKSLGVVDSERDVIDASSSVEDSAAHPVLDAKTTTTITTNDEVVVPMDVVQSVDLAADASVDTNIERSRSSVNRSESSNSSRSVSGGEAKNSRSRVDNENVEPVIEESRASKSLITSTNNSQHEANKRQNYSAADDRPSISKKMKIDDSTVEEKTTDEEDPALASMLSDFVDTLQ